MYIYRVEDPDTGKGPYHPGENSSFDKHVLDDDLHTAHGGSFLGDTHPSMLEDCGIVRKDKALFAGCVSLEQLYTWFSGFWPRLNSTGYVLRIYDCPDDLVKIGTYQVCFPLAAAKKIDEMAISDFLAIVE